MIRKHLKMGLAALGAFALSAAFAPQAPAQPPLSAQSDTTVATAGIDQTAAQSAFSSNGQTSGTLLVVWRRSEFPDVVGTRQDQVRGSLYFAGCAGDVALGPVAGMQDFLIMNQAAPVGLEDENKFDRVTVITNPVTNEFIVLAGGELDVDTVAAGTDTELDTGQAYIQRVNAATGALVGATVVITNGPSTNTAAAADPIGDDAILENSAVSGAVSSDTGNVLVIFGVHVNGQLRGNTTLGGALFDSALTRLDTAGPRFFGVSTRLGKSEPAEFPLHTEGGEGQFTGSVILAGAGLFYDEDTGKFVATTRELHSNTFPLALLAGEIGEPQVNVITVEDGVTANALVRTAPQTIVKSDFPPNQFLTFANAGGAAPGLAGAVDDARSIKNPFGPIGQDNQYLLVYRPARVWSLAQHTSGVVAQFFGLAPNGTVVLGTAQTLITTQTTVLGETTALFDPEDPTQIGTTCEFTGSNFVVSVEDDGENNDPLGTVGRRNHLYYFLLNPDLSFVTGYAVDAPIDIKAIGPANAAADPDMFADVDTSDILDVPGRGYLLSSWDERTVTGQTRHAVRKVIGALPGLTPGPCIEKHPSSVTIENGSDVTLSVTAVGNGTLTYQWQLDGVDIALATSSTLALTNVQVGDSGDYSCIVTDDDGNTTSKDGVLLVTLELKARDSKIFE